MAFPTIEELDALDLGQPQQNAPPPGILSPHDLDQIDLTPAPRFTRPADTVPQISDVTRGGPRIQIPEGGDIGQQLTEVIPTASSYAKGAGSLVSGTRGAVSDIAEKVAGLPEQKENGWRNFKAGISNEPLPIDETLNHPDVGGVLDKISKMGLDLIPRMYLMRGLGAAGVGPATSGALAFGFDEQGKVSPSGAIMGALMPGMSEVGRTVADSVTQKLIDKGLLAAGNKFARNLASEVGAVASIQTLNEALNTPKLAQLYAQDPKEFWKQIAADTLSATAFVVGSAPEWAGSPGPWSGAMRTTIEKTYTPQDLKGIMGKVNAYAAESAAARESGREVDPSLPVPSKDEQDIARFVAASGKAAFGGGVQVTQSNPWIKSPYWQKFFNIAGPEVKMAVLGEQPMKGGPESAPSPEQQQAGVQPEREGIVRQQQIEAAGQAPEPGTDIGNRLPGPAGQPPVEGPVGPPIPPVAPSPGLPVGGISPPVGPVAPGVASPVVPAPESSVPQPAPKPVQPTAPGPAANVPPGGGALSESEFKKQYEAALVKMSKYKPGQIGADEAVKAASSLYDQNPKWADEVEAGIEAKGPTPAPVPAPASKPGGRSIRTKISGTAAGASSPAIKTPAATSATKPPEDVTKVTLSPDDQVALSVIKSRIRHADSIGLAIGGIKDAVRAYDEGNAAEIAQMPPVKDTLRALNMAIADHEWNNDPIYQLIFSAEDGQKKAASLRKMAGEQGLTVKQMQEKVESYLVRVADRVARDVTLSPDLRFAKLVQIYERQPTLSARTSTSVADQAYSTPMPMAYALSWMANVDPKTGVFDDTAGNGMLLIGADLSESHANELNPDREKRLEDFGVEYVSNVDATTWKPPFTVPVVLLNPPFGPHENVNYHGFGIKKLEHIIALRALEAMEPDGRAGMILGANREEKETAKGAQWVFENYLYGHYNVVANFEVSGDLYAKQGAKWPVRIIVIHGVRPDPVTADLAPKNVVRYDNWEQVWAAANAVHDAINSRRQGLVPGGQAGLPVRLPGEPAVRPAEPDLVAGGNAPTPATGGEPGGTGGRKPEAGGKPAAGVPELPAGQTPAKPEVPGVPAEQPGGGGITPPGMEVGAAGNAGATPNAGAGSTPPGPGTKPGVVPEPAAVTTRPAGSLAGLSDDDLDAILDAGFSAAKPVTPPAPTPSAKPKPSLRRPPTSGIETIPGDDRFVKQSGRWFYKATAEPVRSAGLMLQLNDQLMMSKATTPKPPPKPPKKPPTLTPEEIAANLAKTGLTGIGDAIKGLHELFGGGQHMGAFGPTFDEKTYAKAKPYFQSAWEKAKKLGQGLVDFVKALAQQFGDAIRPYLKKFMQEVRAEDEKPPEPPVPKPKPNEFQIEYIPHSKGTPFGTLMPKNIAEAMSKSLDALEAKHGPVDPYVAGNLNMEVAELHQVMSADQIDSVGLAIDQIESGGALVVGHETGIGKGRIGAAVIRYAILQGKIPVFFTKDPKLFSDMYGDLADIHTKVAPLIFGDTTKATIIDPKTGNKLVKSPGKKVQDREMARIMQSGMEAAGYNAIFSTYSQVNDRNDRQKFLEQLAARNPMIIVMDEAHEAAGDAKSSMQAAFFSGGAPVRGSGPTRTTIPVPGLLNAPGTKEGQGGVLYMSATYAKRPENMPVYFRTALSKAAQNFQQIVDAMKKGGVALQQAVSEALAKAGQYTRLERDFSGVSYDFKEVEVKDAAKLTEEVDSVTDVLGQIVDFSSRIQAAVQGSTALTQNAQDMTDFAAIVHNQISQLLLAAKAEAVIKECIDAKARGEKPLIALMSTMESFLGHYVQDKHIAPGMPIKLRWNELTKYALSRTLRRTTKNPDGSRTIDIVNPDEFGLGELYRSIEAAADGIESKFPVSPIDYIIQKLNAAGVKMAELTGRESGIDYTNIDSGEGFYKRFQKANKNKVVNGFNNGVYDGMLLNASGSTGLSAHASKKTGIDERPRHMVIAQPSLDINVFIQTLGRIKRTGMLLLGVGMDGQPYGARYTHLVLPLQAELRPAAKAAKKMKSLNANTTAEADNAIKIESEDIFNRYGDRVVAEYLDAHPEFQGRLELPIDVNDDGSIDVPRDVASRFMGRMALLHDFEQKQAYDQILPAYRELIQQLKATGEYDLEIVVHKDWDGHKRQDDQLAAGTDESNIFTAGTRLQRWDVKDTRHTPTGREMQKEFEHRLGSREKLNETWEQVRQAGDKKITDLDQRITEERAAWQADEDRLDQLSEKEKTAHGVAGARLAQLQVSLSQMTRRWESAKDLADHMVGMAGRVVEVANDETGDLFDGMLTDIKFPTTRYSPSALRFKFMLHSPGGVAYINGAQFGAGQWRVDTSDKEIEDLKGGNLGARYERYLVTGNPIRGYVATGGRGKMVRFTSDEGHIITGLLMPRNWGPAQLANDPRLDLVNGIAAVHFLTNYGMQGRNSVPIEAANIVRIIRNGWGSRSYTISTSKAKATGGKIYLDDPLIAITGIFTLRGNRWIADIDEGELQPTVDRIMQIVGQPFRPVGEANVLMPQVLEANQRGARQGSLGQPEAPAKDRGPVTARSVQELRSAINAPDSGMPKEMIRLMNAFLDSKLGEMLDGVTFHIADALDNGFQGYYWDRLLAVARNASPETGVHEMLHAIWEVLPKELQTEFERLRTETLSDLIKEAEAAGNVVRAATLSHLLDNPTSGGDEFLGRRYPAAMQRELYPLSSAEEYFTNSGSQEFKKKVGSLVDGFWARVKAIISNFIAAVKRAFKPKASRDKLFSQVLKGDFKPTLRQAVAAERTRAPQASLPLSEEEKAAAQAAVAGEGAGDVPSLAEQQANADVLRELGDDEMVKTMVMGHADAVLGRPGFGPQEQAAGAAHAAGIFAKAGLQVKMMPDGFWALEDNFTDQEVEGQRLLGFVTDELAKYAGPQSGYIGNLINSLRLHMLVDDNGAFSKPLRDELYSIIQGEASHRGSMLKALDGFKADIEYMARRVEVHLRGIYAKEYGGPFVEKVTKQIIRDFRDYVTDYLKEHPESTQALQDAIDAIARIEKQIGGGGVFRIVQGALKPKIAKKLARMEADARVQEAARELLQQAKGLGIEPVERPGKPLSPLRKLIHMVNPKTQDKIQGLMEQAIADAERQAGIKAALKGTGSADEREDMEGRFGAGEDPSPEQIEIGLNLPEFSHWKDIRDNLLGYDPITIKLVEQLLRSDFRGTKFAPPAEKVIDTRLDLEKLAKQPDAEVARVIDAYLDNLEKSMDISKATPETKQRIQDMVEAKVAGQVEAARARVRDPLFKPPTAKGAVLTPEQRIGQLINAKLFADPRLNVPAMVARVAARSAVRRLTPKLGDLVTRALQTPFYRQDDIAQNFANLVVEHLGISPEQAAKAKEVFIEAMKEPMAKARAAAMKKAVASVTPRDRALMNPRKPLWQKLTENANAGNFDGGDILRQVAQAHGWAWSDAMVAKMHDLAGRVQRLNELTQAEIAQVGSDPKALTDAIVEKQAFNKEDSMRLRREMATLWSRLTKPLTRKASEGKQNIARACRELVCAKMLFKISHPIRMFIEVTTQGAMYTPTRAVQAAWSRWSNDRSAGRDTNLVADVYTALIDAYKTRIGALKSTLSAMRGAMAGSPEARNVDRMMTGIATFERMAQVAEEKKAAGKHVQAVVLLTMKQLELSYKIMQALDNLQGVPAEYQEMRQRVVTALRENGMDRATSFATADSVIGDIKAEWELAYARAGELMDLAGQEKTSAKLSAKASDLLWSRMLQKIRAIGLPADAFAQHAENVRAAVSWTMKAAGPGAIVSGAMEAVNTGLSKVGVPIPLFPFSNAIATGINRTLTWSGMGFFPGAFKGDPFYASPEDEKQRKLEASVGLPFWLGIFALILAGAGLRYTGNGPKDPREREIWHKQGHRENTLEAYLPDGSFTSWSGILGPLAMIRPWMAMAGAIVDLQERRAKEQQKLNDEAAKLGLQPGKIRPLDTMDWAGIAFETGLSSLIGGRTAVGMTGSFTQEGQFNSAKTIANVLTRAVPLPLEGYQELTRMAGIQMDPKLAGIFDFMIPTGASQARKLNMLGDPVGTEDDIQRITQIFTLGTYPFPIDPKRAAEAVPYAALFNSGYRPPEISPAEGYAIGDEYRPLTNEELSRYAKIRGDMLKQQLTIAGPNADRKEATAAFAAANQQALERLGVDTEAKKEAAAAAAEGPALPATPAAKFVPPGAPTAARISGGAGGGTRRSGIRSLRGMRRPGLSRMSGSIRGPSLRRGARGMPQRALSTRSLRPKRS